MSYEEKLIEKKNEETQKGIGQKIKCSVADCTHNCLEDSTCRLECIKVSVMKDRPEAKCEEGTACCSYDFGGDLNQAEMTGRD